MILIPKFLGIEDHRKVKFGFGVSGEIRCLLYDLNMNLRYDTGWNDNLITDQGLNLLSPLSAGFSNYTYIGSGTNAPTNGDTQMQAFLASSNTLGSGNGVDVVAVPPDYQYSTTLSRRFAAGVGTGTVNEIGLGHNTTSVGALYNRQVLGGPIVKSAENVLDVIWRQTYWPLVTDVLGTVTIDGIVYDTICRGSNYDTSISQAFNRVGESSQFGTDWVAYDGDLSADVEGTPAGDQSNGTIAVTTLPYTPDSHLIQYNVANGLGQWNPTLGIRSVRWRTTIRDVQTQFNAQGTDDRIPKDGTKTIDMTFQYSWARKV